jgi:hypothetical protein
MEQHFDNIISIVKIHFPYFSRINSSDSHLVEFVELNELGVIISVSLDGTAGFVTIELCKLAEGISFSFYSKLRATNPDDANRYTFPFSTLFVYQPEEDAGSLYKVRVSSKFDDPDITVVAHSHLCSARQLVDLIENEYKITNILF